MNQPGAFCAELIQTNSTRLASVAVDLTAYAVFILVQATLLGPRNMAAAEVGIEALLAPDHAVLAM